MIFREKILKIRMFGITARGSVRPTGYRWSPLLYRAGGEGGLIYLSMLARSSLPGTSQKTTIVIMLGRGCLLKMGEKEKNE